MSNNERVTLVEIQSKDLKVYRAFIIALACICFLAGAATAGTWWSLLIFFPLLGIGYLVDQVAVNPIRITYTLDGEHNE